MQWTEIKWALLEIRARWARLANYLTRVLYMSFDKFFFGCWVTWSISSWKKCYKRVFFFNFTKFQFLNNKIYSYTKNNYLALGNLVFWSISSFKTKSKHLSQFFWWEINLRELRGFILQKIWALVAGRQKKKFCQWSLDLGRKKLL